MGNRPLIERPDPIILINIELYKRFNHNLLQSVNHKLFTLCPLLQNKRYDVAQALVFKLGLDRLSTIKYLIKKFTLTGKKYLYLAETKPLTMMGSSLYCNTIILIYLTSYFNLTRRK